MIFGRRLGYVSFENDKKTGKKKEVDYVQQLFVESANMTLIPPNLAYRLNLPVWKRFVRAADGALNLGERTKADYICSLNLPLCTCFSSILCKV